MILVNNTLVQGQHDFYKRVGIVLPEDDSEGGQKGEENQNPVLEPVEPTETDPSEDGGK